MSTLHTIEQEIADIEYIDNIMETYESVAATYMRRTKQSIVKSRVFYDGLKNAYADVSYAYKEQSANKKQKTSFFNTGFWKTLTTRIRQKQEVTVWLSANTGLYGDIIQKTFTAFLQYVTSAKSDIIVVGKRGKLLFDERMPHVRYTYRDLPDTTTSTEDLASLTALFSRYHRVRVFYGKFESFVSQTPISTILGDMQQALVTPSKETSAPTQAKPATLFLFEPSLKEIAHFFETEIVASLFAQITEESRLAKLAARMYQLDAATEHITGILSVMAFEHQKLLHQLENKRQSELVNSRIALGI
ncbi:MAG: hypothetical protein A2719_01150 [Candidatus Ryanbacteria bacterium RIFCSPHIGHO2_01_FULL_45_22]|uniref:ATP synthase gamma chain n=2 Tax=Candidatus Ryaniibacteriota TaxID=1817914 RepID=A0A1G2G026_9BACT|nr:MAG: hypothetical protein A2719_01150 [Candidatus Ryanbacteria bacterium RIFCSPHIGHO2_01_FULL_45_22]OGZ46337.1 MAG: hypothetical protein A3J54_04035 [Candidatus Ryanbacteria bacterium RIFCSPHIGHO2_02_FULL_45_13b]